MEEVTFCGLFFLRTEEEQLRINLRGRSGSRYLYNHLSSKNNTSIDIMIDYPPKTAIQPHRAKFS
jgi:hypothetical protein